MTTTNAPHVAVLNGLIAMTLDSANGYKAAAGSVKKAAFKTLFEDRARKRRDIATALQAEVRMLGGIFQDGGTQAGTPNRPFLDLESKVLGDDQSVIAEVEGAEDLMVAQLRAVLEVEGLPASAKAAVTKASEAVDADQEKMITLTHALHAWREPERAGTS